jgi:ribonuclease D
MLNSLPEAILVTRPAGLQQLVETLARQPIVAVDTESNSLHAYREQVCLIQFSIPQADYLVDPLLLPDIAPLASIFIDPKIEKVFHAAEYDVICLRRDFNFEFANLFDTMAAARILGRKAVGLGDIVLDNHYQRANWGERPMPKSLQTYARFDTHYLIALRDRLRAELVARNLWPLAVEDFARLCFSNGRPPNEDAEACWRINGVRDLSPQEAAVLAELCQYREGVAIALDRPRFKVLGDQTLLKIASTCPSCLDELRGLPGMTQWQMHRHGRAILEAVQRGLHAAPVHPPRTPRPDESFLLRLEALKKWRKVTARKLEIESDVVLPRDLLTDLAARNPRSTQELAETMQTVPWRLKHYGSQILEVLSKHRKAPTDLSPT